MLAVWQPEQRAGAVAEVLDKRPDGRGQQVGGHGVRLPPGHQPFGQRPVAGDHPLEAGMRLGEDLLVDPGGTDPVAGLDLLGVADVVAGQLAGRGEEAEGLGGQPVPAGRIRPALVGVSAGLAQGCAGSISASSSSASATSRPGCDSGASAATVIGQPRSGRRSVDQSVDVAAETKAEDQVALDQPRTAPCGSVQLVAEEGDRPVPQLFGGLSVVRLGTVLVEEGVARIGVVVELDALAQFRQLRLELTGGVGGEVVVSAAACPCTAAPIFEKSGCASGHGINPYAGTTALTASGRWVASTRASPPPMQNPMTPTASWPVRRRSSSTAPLRSLAAPSMRRAIICLPASSGSVSGTVVP